MPRRQTRGYYKKLQQRPDATPDWRWRYATLLVENGNNFSEPRDGREVGRLMRYIRASRKNFVGRKYETAIDDDPHLHRAVQFKSGGWRQSLELQCRVLAGQSPAVIGIEIGVLKETVDTYCMAFFDVAHRLEQTSLIALRVIGTGFNRPSSCEALMMLSAYRHGPLAVDQWLDWWDHQGQFHDTTTPTGRVREQIELFVAARNLPVNDETCFNFAKLAPAILKMRPNTFRQRSANGVIAENTSRLLSEICWGEQTNVEVGTEEGIQGQPLYDSVVEEKVGLQSA